MSDRDAAFNNARGQLPAPFCYCSCVNFVKIRIELTTFELSGCLDGHAL